MSIFNFLKKTVSYKPEDYPKIYLRWKVDGKEYGPMDLSEIPSREQRWSGAPIHVRFENDNKWQKFKFIKKISLKLLASQEQISLLQKYNVSFNQDELKYVEADKLIETIVVPIRNEERKAKKKLPATKQTLKKLDSLGITYHENINRQDASELIRKHEKVEETKQLLSSLSKKGFDVSTKFDLIKITKNKSVEEKFMNHLYLLDDYLCFLNNQNIIFHFQDLMDFTDLDSVVNNMGLLEEYIERLNDFEINYKPPSDMDFSLLKLQVEKLESAIDEIDEIEGQLEEKELSINTGDFKVIGSLSKINKKDFFNDVFKMIIDENWNFDNDIIDYLEKHFPKIKFKEIDWN